MLRGLLLAGAAVLALAGCGSSSSGSSSSSGGNSGGAADAPSGDVSVRSTDLGNVLVDSSGRTLYLFEKDSGPRSECSGPCAKAWPPVVVNAKPTAGKGLDAAKLATSKRADGTTQIVYGGHPLYTFVSDKKPGQTEGQGLDAFGAKWYALETSGAKASGSSGGGSSSGGGYGY